MSGVVFSICLDGRKGMMTNLFLALSSIPFFVIQPMPDTQIGGQQPAYSCIRVYGRNGEHKLVCAYRTMPVRNVSYIRRV